MSLYFYKNSYVQCAYNYKSGNTVFVFLNGLGGVKEFFYEYKKYSKKNCGYFFIDFPGFGSSKFFKKPKKIIHNHVLILKKILKLNKCKKIILISFSLSSVYLYYMQKYKYFTTRIQKIFFIDPVITKNDLEWSSTLLKKNKNDFEHYIKNYKLYLKKILELSLFTKPKNFNNIIHNLKKFNQEILNQANRESVRLIKSKKILSFFSDKKKYFLFPKFKKKLKRFNMLKNTLFIDKCGHYIMFDRPKEVFNFIQRNA